MTLTLENISEVVKEKVPYYISQKGDRVTLNVIDKEGFHIYTFGEDRELILLSSIPLNEIKQDILDFFNEKIETLNMGVQ